MFTIPVIFFCAFLSVTRGIPFVPDSSTIVFDRIDGNCDGKKLAILGTYRISKTEKRVIFINVTKIVKEDINEKLLLTLIVNRCRSKENLDTCEEFVKQTGLHYCQIIDPSTARFNPMFMNFTPVLKCPYKKGVYKTYNSKVDTSALSGFPMQGYYWRTRTEIITATSNKLIECLKADVYLKKINN